MHNIAVACDAGSLANIGIHDVHQEYGALGIGSDMKAFAFGILLAPGPGNDC